MTDLAAAAASTLWIPTTGWRPSVSCTVSPSYQVGLFAGVTISCWRKAFYDKQPLV